MPGPRSRRRAVLLVAVALLVTVIALLADAGASNKPNVTEAVQAYLDQVRPGVQQTTSQGSDFADIRANAATLGRDALDRRLDELASEVRTTLASIDSLTPPASLRVAQAYLVAALGVRAKAVAEARPAFDAALTEGGTTVDSVAPAVGQLETVGQDLELGDRAFALFIGALPPNTGIASAPGWISDQTQWSEVQLTPFVDVLRSSASARPIHDISMLAFQTNPPAVAVAPDGTQTIPASPTTSVSMVIENVGNQPESNVTVYVILTLADGSQEHLRDFIDMTPGETRALTLTPLPTQPGMSGRIVAEVLPVPGQTDTTTSSISAPVVFK